MHRLRLKYSNYFYVGFSSLYINHRGLSRFHRGHTAYIPYIYILTYIGSVTSMKAIQAPQRRKSNLKVI